MFHEHEHVGAPVLDGLERSDSPTKLRTRPRVFNRHVEKSLGAANLLRGQQRCAYAERSFDRLVGISSRRKQTSLNTVERDPRLAACLIESWKPYSIAAVHEEQAKAFGTV